MNGLQQINRALLRTLMSPATANIVAERLEELEAENANLKRLMRRAIPTIDSRETDYADEFKAACR